MLRARGWGQGVGQLGRSTYTGSLRRSARQNVPTVALVIFGYERRPLCNLFFKRVVPRGLQAKNEKQLLSPLGFRNGVVSQEINYQRI